MNYFPHRYRYQTLFLLLATLISCIVFFASRPLPDHFWEVSSLQTHSSPLTYFLTSLGVVVESYSGPWCFLPFLVWFPLVLTVFRNSPATWARALSIFPLCGLFFSLSLLFFPSFVGQALLFHFQEALDSPLWPVLTSLAGLATFVALSFPIQMLELLKLRKFVERWHGQVRSSPLGEALRAVSNFPLVPGPGQDSISLDRPMLSSETRSERPAVQAKGGTKQKAPSKQKVIEHRTAGQLNDLISCLETSDWSLRPTPGTQGQKDDNTIECIERKLLEFKIKGQIVNVLKGPVVDTYELELGPGVKVSKVTSLTEDLSLALCGVPIRMVYPMKGKTTIGIEVPKNVRDIIFLDEILKDDRFRQNTSALPLALGKNAFGEVVLEDLSKMPHMLIAGSTGAGKSVFLNTLLVSILIKVPPQKMRLILIDPKQLELALYGGLPHLIHPVVSSSKKALLSLTWACYEMEKRYTLLKNCSVRNIEGFNGKVQQNPQMRVEGEKVEPLPYIIIVIDEFADLILGQHGKEIENRICKLAAKARASGIHLVIATQRPSVDVITGLIKTNFPTRVSFRVTSSVDSRTILNALGAEKLLGKGDMLFKTGVEIKRFHSAFIEEDDIENLVKKLEDSEVNFHPEALDMLNQYQDDEEDFRPLSKEKKLPPPERESSPLPLHLTS